jgi:polysaccharide pyruvyl transferase WcaK-like protein
MRLVAPFGFYGWGNIGDEATLQGFARLVFRHDSRTRAWIASRNPAHTARVEPRFSYYKAVGRDLRRRWARYRAAAAVVAGGTPIMDVLGRWPLNELAPLVVAASDERKPVAFIGCGTEGLHRDDSRRIVADVLAPRVCCWTVRSERDKQRLTDYGVPAQRIAVAADMAWLLDAVSPKFGQSYLAKIGIVADRPIVGVNVNIEPFVRERQPLLLKNLARSLDRLVEECDVQVLFLCNEVREGATFDAAASREVIESMVHRQRTMLAPNHYWAPEQMMSLIACCQLTVSTRYHFCLFSTVQGVPFVALKRSDKVSDLCADMNWPHALSLDELSPSTLLQVHTSVTNRRTLCMSTLSESARALRSRALGNSTALDALAREAGK